MPVQDKDYLVAFAQLPDAATLDRTEAVIRKMSTIALEQPGVASSVAFPGLSINGLRQRVERRDRVRHAQARRGASRAGPVGRSIVQALNGRFAGIQEAFVAIFPPPPVQGLGTVGGFKLYVEDRAGLGFEELHAQVQGAIGQGRARADAGGPVLELPGQRAADRRRRRSRAREDLRRQR